MKWCAVFLAVATIGAFSAHAGNVVLPPETSKSAACAITPAVGAINYPGGPRVPHTNDLVRSTGKPDDAEGQVVNLMGKVVDANCVPLPDVIVELWQPDPYSKFLIPTNADMATPVQMFAGAGKTYTGEDGTFTFRTLFPGTLRICQKRDARGRCISSIERAPFFNIRISGRSLNGAVSMGLFFENDRRNPSDPVYKKLSAAGRQALTMKVLPSTSGDYGSGMRTYIELAVPTKKHWHGY